MFKNGNFIFLGDAESYQIKKIKNSLVKKGRKKFDILVAPHHGIHWHDSLRQLRFTQTISSNCKNFVSKTKPLKEISKTNLSTFVNGPIFMSLNNHTE